MVFLSGRSEFLEKHEETVGELQNRGWHVFGMDWRGQGLSGRMLKDRQKGHVRSYSDYVRDLKRFLDRIAAPAAPRPVYILAHSMGAHIALRYLHRETGLIAGAVLVSPMLDIYTPPFPQTAARRIVGTAVRLGMSEEYAPGQGAYQPTDRRSFRRNRLTRDFRRYMDEQRAVERCPELALGGVTCGWLNAAFDSIDRLRSPRYAEQIRTPVMMVCAGGDRVVPFEAQRDMHRRIKFCDLTTIPNAYHEILKEKDAVRKVFWEIFGRFTDKKT